MRRWSGIDRDRWVAAVTLGFTAAVAFFVGLVLLAKPPGAEAELARVGGASDAAARLTASTGDPGAWPEGAVCRTSPIDAAVAMRPQLAAAAQAVGVSTSDILLSPEPRDDLSARLTPVSIRIVATGPYDGEVRYLAALSRLHPTIFLDKVELRSQATLAGLVLKGRFFCSTSARPSY